MWFVLYKKELFNLFYSRTAYITLFVYFILSMLAAFFGGMYFVVDNPSMRSYFAFQSYVLLVIIPAVTMKLWADEKKTGTIEILMTLPITDWKLVSAKFAAAWSSCFLMLIMSIPLCISTIFTIDSDKLNILSSYIGAIMSAGVLSALGSWLSCQTQTSVSGYLMSVLVGWCIVGLNFSPLLSLFVSGLPNSPFLLSDALNFSTHYKAFLNGLISVDDFFYFISLISLFLFFNLLVVYGKRNSK